MAAVGDPPIPPVREAAASPLLELAVGPPDGACMSPVPRGARSASSPDFGAGSDSKAPVAAQRRPGIPAGRARRRRWVPPALLAPPLRVCRERPRPGTPLALGFLPGNLRVECLRPA